MRGDIGDITIAPKPLLAVTDNIILSWAGDSHTVGLARDRVAVRGVTRAVGRSKWRESWPRRGAWARSLPAGPGEEHKHEDQARAIHDGGLALSHCGRRAATRHGDLDQIIRRARERAEQLRDLVRGLWVLHLGWRLPTELPKAAARTLGPDARRLLDCAPRISRAPVLWLRRLGTRWARAGGVAKRLSSDGLGGRGMLAESRGRSSAGVHHALRMIPPVDCGGREVRASTDGTPPCRSLLAVL
jgi:hypothetical protein